MAKSTDKLYEVDKEDVLKSWNMIFSALSETHEMFFMTVEDINALSRILAYRLTSGDDNGMYEHTVDFLWMSFRIELNHKMLLLDLLDKGGL